MSNDELLQFSLVYNLNCMSLLFGVRGFALNSGGVELRRIWRGRFGVIAFQFKILRSELRAARSTMETAE